ncbi:WecB/TagA/CpsF family glycosyltransferase [Synechococcus sp. M16CYN]|uniref:WecB/TagA/CpsF family glycosyltransferase n=1 Tax=Synechococcus sp. M16CYN TaxID=3103139 RepID=UPI00324EF4FE
MVIQPATKACGGCHRYRVLGFPVDVCCDVQVAALDMHVSGGGRIVTLNAEMTMAARMDKDLGSAIINAELVIPDGAGVVWALSKQGVRVVKTAGIELAWSLLNYAASHGWTVALVGASPNVMASLKIMLFKRFPGLRLVFAVDGYQSAEAWPHLESKLRELRPDLVLVALGVPRQETWSHRVQKGQHGLWMGVGGSFDVWAGTKKRAPKWMCRMQIEWLYRLIQEPNRWKRMLSLPAFVWQVIKGELND